MWIVHKKLFISSLNLNWFIVSRKVKSSEDDIFAKLRAVPDSVKNSICFIVVQNSSSSYHCDTVLALRSGSLPILGFIGPRFHW